MDDTRASPPGRGLRLLGLLVVVVLIVLLWDTWIVYPLKILVVFFHELSHGLAAVLTGGSIERIELQAAEGGMAVTRGGSRFVILSAGYLGSLLLGGLLLVAAARSRHDRRILAGLGVVLLGVTLLFVRPWFGFGMLFGLTTGAALLAAARLLGSAAADILLKVIGLTSCLYAVLDIKSDVLDRSELQSDARMLAELTGLPTVVWGLIWIVVAVLATLGFLRAAAASPEPEASPPA